MNNSGKFKAKIQRWFTFLAILSVFITLHLKAKPVYVPVCITHMVANGYMPDTSKIDSIVLGVDTIPASFANKLTYRRPDYLTKGWNDSTAYFAEFVSPDSLDAPITYKAEDSAVMLYKQKEATLYGKADIKYTDVEINANVININTNTKIITAYGGVDTGNSPLNKPKITQAGSKSIMDTIRYNYKTQKAISYNAFYNEGEMFVNAEKVKKVSKDVAYAYDGRFTTCNLDTPHFDFRAKKMKLITNKMAITGPVYPEIEGVPLPIVLPFGVFPLTRGRHSGMLAPQFAQNQSAGLGLEGLGYYKVFNDNWDVTLRSNLYSYGGYMIAISPRYLKRYAYSGNLSFQYQYTKLLNQSASIGNEYNVNKSFSLAWSHSMDSKARPGTSFSASVNVASTSFNQYVTNNPVRNYTNQLSSSITYGKQWEDGKYNLTVSANHNQNNNTKLVNVQFPTVNFSMNTIYPFAKQENLVGTPKWYQKLGISYSGTFLNQVAFYDNGHVNMSNILDTTQYGFTHNVPITLSLPALGPIMISPSVTYNETWYSNRYDRVWNAQNNKIDTAYSRGLYAARQVGFGLGLNSRIYGTYRFKPTSKVVAIRHEIRPTFNINYTPDLQRNNYQWVRYNNRERGTSLTVPGAYMNDPYHVYNNPLIAHPNIYGDATLPSYAYPQVMGDSMRVSRYSGNIVGAYSEGSFGGITFGFDNLLEMKVKNDKDTTGDDDKKTKKVKLIDGLSIMSGYNFLADSLRWQPITMNFRTTLFNKVNINGTAVIDPYQLGMNGQRINKLYWSQGRLGRFTNGNLSLSSSFSSKSGDKDKQSTQDQILNNNSMSYDQQQAEMNYVNNNPAEFVDFNSPWNVSTSMAMSFYNTLVSNVSNETRTTVTASLNVNGDYSITPRLKLGGNVSYDLKRNKPQMVTMFITREMHCWQMSINITPIGIYKSFSIVLSPKAGILRDLKINRSRYFYDN